MLLGTRAHCPDVDLGSGAADEMYSCSVLLPANLPCELPQPLWKERGWDWEEETQREAAG